MKHFNEFINEALGEAKKKKYQKELDELLKQDHFKDLDPNKEIWSLWRNLKKKEMYLYKTESYEALLQLWLNSKEDPDENGRYCSFQLSENSAHSVCNSKPFKKLKLIDKTQ